MDIYYPKRSGLSAVFVAFNFAAYTAFAAGSVYLSGTIIHQFLLAPSVTDLLVLILPPAFLVALLRWGSGTLDLFTSHFDVSISDGRLRFDYVGRPFGKRKEVMLNQIKAIEIHGHPKTGVWITLRMNKGSHRLGHLLDPEDAFRIIKTLPGVHAFGIPLKYQQP